MPHDSIFGTHYAQSQVLIIGINRYTNVSPLQFACNDANAIAEYLREQLAFPPENIVLFLDGEATRQAIMAALLKFTGDDVGADDRLLVFFAGHGHTRSAWRGEVGYLVP